MLRVLGLSAAALLLGACAIQRAQVANDAKDKMIGLTKEQVLACMGPPANRMSEGVTEVWSYQSGDGTVVSSGSANVYASRGTGQAFGSAVSLLSRRFCQVNVVMNAGRVSQLGYQGPTGGLLTAGEQCAYVVQNCAR
jgi:hypothetical protein